MHPRIPPLPSVLMFELSTSPLLTPLPLSRLSSSATLLLRSSSCA